MAFSLYFAEPIGNSLHWGGGQVRVTAMAVGRIAKCCAKPTTAQKGIGRVNPPKLGKVVYFDGGGGQSSLSIVSFS